jgi:hypothetical protein
MPSGYCSHSRVLETTSVSKNVTVPTGKLGGGYVAFIRPRG